MYHKILITASTFAHIRSFHLPYLAAFHDAGTVVHVAGGGSVCEFSDADRIIPVPFEKKIMSPSNLRAAKQLHQLISTEHYDLVITHTSLAAFYTRLALRGIRNPPRTIYMCHGYLFDHDSSLPRFKALLSAERLVARQTDLLLTMNRYDYDLAKKYSLGRQIALIPGVGVDFSQLDQSRKNDREILRQEFGIPADAFVLFYAAEFSSRKNQEFLIRSMISLPKKVFLVLAGDGELLSDCKHLADDLGLTGRILFPGHVSPISDWYVMADAAVSSSRSEGLPFNIMEAMHFGLPIVASDVKGNSDLIRDGETGILFPYNDYEIYIQSVAALLNSPDKYTALGSHAATASQRYALNNVFPIAWKYYLSFT